MKGGAWEHIFVFNVYLLKPQEDESILDLIFFPHNWL